MSLILVDSSVWIDYFRGSKQNNISKFDDLIDSNNICVNDLILSELLPSLLAKNQSELADLLRTVRRISLNIDWEEIIIYQKINLKKGINNIGIPDLIILQNVIQNSIPLYTFENHFSLMRKYHVFSLY